MATYSPNLEFTPSDISPTVSAGLANAAQNSLATPAQNAAAKAQYDAAAKALGIPLTGQTLDQIKKVQAYVNNQNYIQAQGASWPQKLALALNLAALTAGAGSALGAAGGGAGGGAGAAGATGAEAGAAGAVAPAAESGALGAALGTGGAEAAPLLADIGVTVPSLAGGAGLAAGVPAALGAGAGALGAGALGAPGASPANVDPNAGNVSVTAHPTPTPSPVVPAAIGAGAGALTAAELAAAGANPANVDPNAGNVEVTSHPQPPQTPDPGPPVIPPVVLPGGAPPTIPPASGGTSNSSSSALTDALKNLLNGQNLPGTIGALLQLLQGNQPGNNQTKPYLPDIPGFSGPTAMNINSTPQRMLNPALSAMTPQDWYTYGEKSPSQLPTGGNFFVPAGQPAAHNQTATQGPTPTGAHVFASGGSVDSQDPSSDYQPGGYAPIINPAAPAPPGTSLVKHKFEGISGALPATSVSIPSPLSLANLISRRIAEDRMMGMSRGGMVRHYDVGGPVSPAMQGGMAQAGFAPPPMNPGIQMQRGFGPPLAGQPVPAATPPMQGSPGRGGFGGAAMNGALSQMLAQLQQSRRARTGMPQPQGQLHPWFGLPRAGLGQPIPAQMSMSHGGDVEGALSQAMHHHAGYVRGPGDGQSDDIDAKLADGEYVFSADVVSALGNGSNEAGAKRLDAMMHNVRTHASKNHAKGKLQLKAKHPEQYLGK